MDIEITHDTPFEPSIGVKRVKTEKNVIDLPNYGDRDHLNAVLSGHTNLQVGNEKKILSSWLTSIHWFTADYPMIDHDEPELLLQIQSHAMQLIQVKQRLGPTAERASKVQNSSGLPVRTTTHQLFQEARRASNPFEVLGEGRDHGLNQFFMNRSAIKLANIDSILNFELTKQSDRSIGTCTGDGSPGPFIFADLCGAPGGFSEYIMTRCRSEQASCRGYGMSLSGSNEHGNGIHWKLGDMFVTDQGCSTNYRVCHGVDGSGDIFDWHNVLSMSQILQFDHAATPGLSVSSDTGWKAHLVTADGGFDAQRNADNQEEITQKLVVCQVAASLELLRIGGTFVIKMFGFQTDVIKAVMTDLHLLFERFVILKPITSRPASAERYCVFSGFKGTGYGWDGRKWRDRMFLGLCNVLPSGTRSRLFHYLNESDRDLVSLNLKACFAILSRLDSKCTLQNGRLASMSRQLERVDVDIEKYQQEWRLH